MLCFRNCSMLRGIGLKSLVKVRSQRLDGQDMLFLTIVQQECIASYTPKPGSKVDSNL